MKKIRLKILLTFTKIRLKTHDIQTLGINKINNIKLIIGNMLTK